MTVWISRRPDAEVAAELKRSQGPLAGVRLAVKDNVDGFVGGSVTYRSSTYGDFVPDPRFFVAPYTLLDLRAGIEKPDGSWRVSLYGRNITNKYYWTTATRRADALVRWAGMPRTYGVDVTLRY